ncbi:hypothetical protein ABPG75_009086 [Micractinium tetrahymenae]
MAVALETYAATLREVCRQAAQLQRSASGNGGGSGPASGESTPASEGSGASRRSASASSASGWVVLESATTPAALPGEAGGCSVWPQAQWQVAYEILFCQCPPALTALRPHGTDDMLFFVYTDEAAAAARSRLFVRRRQAKAAALPADLAAAPTAAGAAPGTSARGHAVPAAAAAAPSRAGLVDWRASVLLMLVLQTAYRLSVVTADDPELLNAALEEAEAEPEEPGRGGGGGGGRVGSGREGGSSDGSGGSSRLRRVTKVVHASPSHVPVNLDHSRSEAGTPQASYPEICFAVDSCDDAFQSQVLRHPGDCYCVLLHADVAHSWSLPAARAAAAPAAGGGSEAADAAAAGVEALAQAEGQRSGRHSSRDGGGGSRRSTGSAQSTGSQQPSPHAGKHLAAVMFSGYVSHAQLTSALGGQLAGDPLRQVLRAAAAAARGQPAGGQGGGEQAPLATCRVSMRGPGGQGAADVAVSSYPPTPAAEGGGASSGDASSVSGGTAPGRAGAAPPQPGRPNFFERASLLARGMAAAAKQAAAGPKAGAGGAAGVPLEQLQLRCALMALQVPVDALALAILAAL